MSSPRTAGILSTGILSTGILSRRALWILALLLGSAVARADQPPAAPEGPPCRREDVGKPCNSRGSLCREKERRQGRKLVTIYRCDFDWSTLGGPETEAPKKRLFSCAMGAGAPNASEALLPMLLTFSLLLGRRRLQRMRTVSWGD